MTEWYQELARDEFVQGVLPEAPGDWAFIALGGVLDHEEGPAKVLAGLGFGIARLAALDECTDSVFTRNVVLLAGPSS